jgi:hypothetical protein
MNFDPLDTFSQVFLATYAEAHPPQEKANIPRWSGIARCARGQYYGMIGVEVTDPSDGRGIWVAEKGRLVQEEVLKTLEAMGHNVVVWEGRRRQWTGAREVTLGGIADAEGWIVDDNRADYPPWSNPFGPTMITGHIDAEVEFYDRPDLGITVTDCKDRNYLAYMRWASNPLTDADPEAYFQMQGYLLCRKREWACFVVTAQDSAATKGEITKKMRSAKSNKSTTYNRLKGDLARQQMGQDGTDDPFIGSSVPGPFPNPAIFRFFVPANPDTQTFLLRRAQALIVCRDNERLPEREHKPGRSWRCDYCDYRQRCERDGEGGIVVPHWGDLAEVG